ncbi:MAG: cation transporter [Thermovenabulum sp.]|uniref:cation transporter n=1 Tax=Thermovenabulum sp. TaxID=3100335 RepID=UPI003C7E6993
MEENQTNKEIKVNMTLKVLGMSCHHCKHAIESALKKLNGVISAEAFVREGKVEVSLNPDLIKKEDIIKAIEEVGYDVEGE